MRKRLLLISILILAAIAGCVGWRIGKVVYYPDSQLRSQEQVDLQESFYSCLRLSMLPVEDMSVGDIELFSGLPTKEVSYSFCNLKDLNAFLVEAYRYQEALETVYLHLDPIEICRQYGGIARFYGKAYADYLGVVMNAHPETTFECVLPAYSAEYWRSMGESQRQDAAEYIVDFFNVLGVGENRNIYFVGFEEWLIGNRENYVDERLNTAEAHTLLTAFVMGSDYYVLTGENIAERLAMAQQVSMETIMPGEYDLSGCDVVFFGDSVFGNFEGSTSIPGIVNGLSGAGVYNLGYGGMPATTNEISVLPFEYMVDRFLTGDTEGLPECNFVSGLQQYLADNHDGREQYFIINFGINDYFKAFPLDNPEEPYDTTCYGGALRSGIRRLQEHYPEATILVMVSNYVEEYVDENGAHSDKGIYQEDYIRKAMQVAQECGVECFDIYFDGAINADTTDYYLADHCHPNERGRFLIGKELVQKLGEIRRSTDDSSVG